jgi:hypothetical protein
LLSLKLMQPSAGFLARTLAIPDAAFVAEITNAVLAAHNLVWRLVALS